MPRTLRIKKADLLLLLSASFGLGFVAAGLMLAHWDLPQEFWNFRLIEAIEICVTLLVALFIARIVSDRSSREAKQRELYEQLVKDTTSHLEAIRSSVDDFINGQSSIPPQRIINLFNTLSRDLAALLEFGAILDYSGLRERLRKPLADLRAFGTGTIFDEDPKTVTLEHRLFEKNVDDFKMFLHRLRFKLYT